MAKEGSLLEHMPLNPTVMGRFEHGWCTVRSTKNSADTVGPSVTSTPRAASAPVLPSGAARYVEISIPPSGLSVSSLEPAPQPAGDFGSDFLAVRCFCHCPWPCHLRSVNWLGLSLRT